MSENLIFTLNGIPISITSTTINPLSNAPATNGNWLYYLYYYSNTNGQPDILECTSNTGDIYQVLYVCTFAQGGNGGPQYGDTGENSYGQGGGGGGGRSANIQLFCPITVNLFSIGDSTPCTTVSAKMTYSSNPDDLFLPNGFTFTYTPGGNGSNGSNSVGGPGGTGGGAGGNGGLGNTTNGTPGQGQAYGNTGFVGASPVASTPEIFYDQTTANVASGGAANYSGNIAGCLFCYQVSG